MIPLGNAHGKDILPTLILTVSIVVLSCTPSPKHQILNPKYQNKVVYGTLLVLPVTTDLMTRAEADSLSRGDAVGRMYPTPAEKEFYIDFFGASIAEATLARVLGIDPYHNPKDLEFTYERFRFEDETETGMFVPTRGNIVYRDETPNFILFIDALSFEKQFGEIRQERGYEGMRYRVRARVSYLFWDNVNARVAAYGNIDKTYPVVDVPASRDYIYIFEDLAQRIIQHSPFVLRETG